MTTSASLASAELPVKDSQLSTALTGGQTTMLMKVTDYEYGQINPAPIKLHKDMELLEEFLSPRKLQAMTGVENLDTVDYLEMRVNTDQMSLGNFGMYVPNLSQIKLTGSFIPSIRDLGTSLWNLQVLWMPQCCLRCLDGLVTMSSIRELYLAYNEIDDISPCGMLEQLEILDLEGNRVADTGDLHYLSMCPRLARLTLEGNPVCAADKHADTVGGYRAAILGLVPQLEFLDDLPRRGESRSGDGPYTEGGDDGEANEERHCSDGLALEDHWSFINEMLVEAGLLAESARGTNDSRSSASTPADSGRPASCGPVRPGSGGRMTTGMVSGTASGRRPLTGRGPQDTGDSPVADEVGTALGHRLDDSSLTAGPLVCGSITQSLRRRPDEPTRCKTAARGSEAVRTRQHQVPATARGPTETDIDESCEAVLKQLGQWRRDYEISRARIEKQKAPQVLTIECKEDEIEHVVIEAVLPSAIGSAERAGTQKPAASVPQFGAVQPPPASGTKKLNPIRCPPPPPQGSTPSANRISSRQSPWTQSVSTPTGKSAALPNGADYAVPHASCVTEKPPPVHTMSRMRRQLLQSVGAGSIVPSKPLLKR